MASSKSGRAGSPPGSPPEIAEALARIAARPDSHAVVGPFTALIEAAAKKPAQLVSGLKKLVADLDAKSSLGGGLLDEGARVLLALGDAERAGLLFSLARRAERASGASATPAEQIATFRAFAERAALDHRDLQRLLKSLAKTAPADALCDLVSAYLVGGGAPWATLTADVDAALKAQKVAPAARSARLEALLDRVIGAPGARRAPLEFWQTHHAAFAARLAADGAAAAWALDLFPPLESNAAGAALADAWVELLRAATFEALLAGRAPVPGGPAGWLGRALTWVAEVSTHCAAALDLVDAVAPALRGGPPFVLPVTPRGLDPDVVDRLLALGVTLAPPAAEVQINLYHWNLRRRAGLRGAPLEHLAADPQFRPLLDRVFARDMAFDTSWTQEALLATLDLPACRGLWRDWVAQLAVDLGGGTLFSLAAAATHLQKWLSPALAAAVPEVVERVARIDLAAALGRTLRAGVRDEWGWPAMDEANARLAPPRHPFSQGGFYPVNVVHGDGAEARRAVVVGPDGILGEVTLPMPEGAREQGVAWVDGQVLNVFDQGSLQKQVVWSGAPEDVRKVDWLQTWVLTAATPGGGVTAGGRTIRPHTFELEETARGVTARVFSDGAGFWRLPARAITQGGVWARTQKTWRNPLEAFDPETGQVVADAALPAFLCPAADEQAVDLATSFLLPAPHAGESGLGRPTRLPGAPVPVHGVRVAQLRDGRARVTFADGRRWEGEAQPQVLGAVAWPGRDDLMPIRLEASDQRGAVYTPDGRSPLIPWIRRGYGDGSAQPLPFDWWGLVRPRDLAASAALRALPEAAAAAILAAARAESADAGAGVEVVQLSPQATLSRAPTAAPAPDAAHPGTAAAVRAALPAPSHSRLVAGVVGLALEAARLGRIVDAMAATVGDIASAAAVAPADDLHDAACGVVERLVGSGGYLQGGDGRVGRQIAETLAFFRAPTLAGAPADAADGLQVRQVSRTAVAWERVPGRARALAWRGAALAASPAERAALDTLLRLTAELSAPDLRGRLRSFVASAPGYPTPSMSWHSPQALLATADGQHRWLLRLVHSAAEGLTLAGVEYRAGDAFAPPERLPGLTLTWTAAVPEVPAAARAALGLAVERGAFPAEAAAIAVVAEQTGLMPGAAALLWSGGALGGGGDGLRTTLGLTQTDWDRAGHELQGALAEVYDRALPEAVETLWAAPSAAPGVVDLGAAARLAAAWCAVRGRLFPLDRDLVARLVDDFGDRARPERHLRIIAACASPEPTAAEHTAAEHTAAEHTSAEHTATQGTASAGSALDRDATFAIRPYRGFQSNVSYMAGWIPAGWPLTLEQPDGDERVRSDVFTGALFRELVRYVPWLHQETPVGHPLREALPAFCRRVTARLANPGLLLLGGAVDLSREGDRDALAAQFAALIAPFTGLDPYRSPDDRPVAPGLDRGDLVVTWPTDVQNSVFLAVRPSRLDAPAALGRLARDLGIFDAFNRPGGGGCTCGLRFGQHTVIDVTELRELLVWRAPGFADLIARTAATPVAPGRYEADPRASAPALVAAARAQHDLSEDAACLWLQTLALARPARLHVQRYNGWEAARYRGAGAELLARGLVDERTVRATGRELFIAGEDLVEPSTRASPLERSKLALYGLELDADGRFRPPLVMVLPLSPLPRIFEDAWAARTARIAARG